MVATTIRGAGAADLLVGGLVLAGALMPVVRADTTRAIRDFGVAAVGLIIMSVCWRMGWRSPPSRGAGVLLVAAVCLGCAGSDVGAFIVGKRFGNVAAGPVALAVERPGKGSSATSSGRRSASPCSRPPCRRSATRSCCSAWS